MYYMHGTAMFYNYYLFKTRSSVATEKPFTALNHDVNAYRSMSIASLKVGKGHVTNTYVAVLIFHSDFQFHLIK